VSMIANRASKIFSCESPKFFNIFPERILAPIKQTQPGIKRHKLA
jgi:hypothetical protein